LAVAIGLTLAALLDLLLRHFVNTTEPNSRSN
jgi:hypothetical protein